MEGVTTLGDLLFAGDDDGASLLLHTAGQDHPLDEVRERATAVAARWPTPGRAPACRSA